MVKAIHCISFLFITRVVTIIIFKKTGSYPRKASDLARKSAIKSWSLIKENSMIINHDAKRYSRCSLPVPLARMSAPAASISSRNISLWHTPLANPLFLVLNPGQKPFMKIWASKKEWWWGKKFIFYYQCIWRLLIHIKNRTQFL